MAIEIRKRPFYYCFSGNPVHYELYSAQAAAFPGVIIFEVIVRFETIGGVIKETEAFEYTPVNGFAEVNIQAILEGFLTTDLPQLAGGDLVIWQALNQTGFFYIKYREITPANADPSWDESEADYKSFVIKGGLSRFKYQGNNFFANYFEADIPNVPRPFLTWQQSGRLASLQERMYLAYLLIDEIGVAANLKVKGKVTYTDGTFAEQQITLSNVKNRISFLPAGAAQWGFSQAKQIWFWEITVQDITAPLQNVLSHSFRFYADNRNDYNDVTLHYRNSLGGLDSVRIRGMIEHNLEYDYQEVQKVQRHDYFDGHFFDPQNIISNNKELKVFRADIGHLEKEEQDRLRDAFLKRECWMEIDKKWWPIKIITKSIKQKLSEDTRWSLPIDFSLAHDGDSHYTPDNVDLGEGTYTSNVCRAYLGDIVVAVFPEIGFKNIAVTFNEVDPDNDSTQIRYRVTKQSDGSVVIPWTIIPFISPLQFPLGNDDHFFLEIQAVCSNAIYGKKSTMGIDTHADSTGTGNSIITNNRSGGAFFNVYRNGAKIVDAKYIGGNATYQFDVANGVNLVFKFEAAGISPSSATISNGVVTLSGVIVPAGLGCMITFPAISTLR